jgi:hypothetical protein
MRNGSDFVVVGSFNVKMPSCYLHISVSFGWPAACSNMELVSVSTEG